MKTIVITLKGKRLKVNLSVEASWYDITAILSDGTRVPMTSTAQVLLMRRIAVGWEMAGKLIDPTVVGEFLKKEFGYYV